MALGPAPFSFPSLPKNTFKGLPGLLADALPDKYGDRLINAWLAEQGRTPDTFNPVERLCYVGTLGMGALEFQPAVMGSNVEARKIEVANLVRLANMILNEKARLEGILSGKNDLTAIVFAGLHRAGTVPAGTVLQ